MKTIDRIDLIFENSEQLTIYSEDIKELYISNVYSGIETFNNTILDILKTDSFLLNIGKDANIFIEHDEHEESDREELVFDRLKMYNDIKEIVLVYIDENIKRITIEWSPNVSQIDYLDFLSAYENPNQNYLALDDSLVVYSGKDFDNTVRNKLTILGVPEIV